MSAELKPGYKQTEVGVIPEDWEVVRLGQLLASVPAYGINAPAVPYDSRFPTYLRITDISEDGRFIDESKVSVKHQLAASYVLSEGDLVFARTGASVGKSYLYDRWDGELVFAGFLICVRPDTEKLKPAFLKYFAQSSLYGNWVKVNSMRSGQPGINGREYASLPIPLPPTKAEQEAIAEVLSDADALIESLEQLIAKKRHLKQGAMQELLTGKKRLPGYSGEWEEKRFADVAFPRRDRVDPRRTGVHEFCVELEHIESASGVLLGSTSTGDQSSLKSVFRPGDVLFGKLRAYLRKYWLATRSGVCSTEIWVFVPNDRLITTDYLFQLIKTDRFIEAASNAYGTHMPRSDWNVVKNYELPLPLLPEQAAIATILPDMDAEIAALEAKLAKARQIKQGMMQELLTGKTRLV